MRLGLRLLHSAPSGLSVGQRLVGKIGSYKLLERFQNDRDVWLAVNDDAEKVVVKRAPKQRLQIERDVLQTFSGSSYIRQLIDTIEDERALVLRFLDDNLLKVSEKQRLEGSDLKLVARNILEALSAIHEKGFVHTDVKPDNILVNHGHGTARFEEVLLGDCGDFHRFNPKADPKGEGHIIGPVILEVRKPCLIFDGGLPPIFGPSEQQWLIRLIYGTGFHLFDVQDIKFNDPDYPFWVLVEHIKRFGPIELSYQDIASDQALSLLAIANNLITDNPHLNVPFANAVDKELLKEDRAFILKIMKLDPRDRPTAAELLKDEWFSSTKATIGENHESVSFKPSPPINVSEQASSIAS